MVFGMAAHRAACVSFANIRALAIVFSVLLSLLGATFGCGQPRTGPVSPVQTKLSWLGSMYGMYIGQHKGQAPATIAELRAFVEKSTTSEQLERLKVGSVDDLFKSPRDGKPFRLVTYKALPAPAGGSPPPVVLYEEVGEGGQRSVAYLGGGTDEVADAKLKSLLPPGSK
jgi:hypothetical protein